MKNSINLTIFFIGVFLLFIQTTSNVINVLLFAFGFMMVCTSLCFMFYNLILNLNNKRINNGKEKKEEQEGEEAKDKRE